MPILYALVARGKDVLAEYTSTTGNFPAVTRVLLAKIAPTDTRMSVSYDSYYFHYIVANGCTYLCMADERSRRRLPFLFLEDIRSRFEATYGDDIHSMIAFAANKEFSRILAQQMVRLATALGLGSGVADRLASVPARHPPPQLSPRRTFTTTTRKRTTSAACARRSMTSRM